MARKDGKESPPTSTPAAATTGESSAASEPLAAPIVKGDTSALGAAVAMPELERLGGVFLELLGKLEAIAEIAKNPNRHPSADAKAWSELEDYCAIMRAAFIGERGHTR
jgi:hypothetical protein